VRPEVSGARILACDVGGCCLLQDASAAPVSAAETVRTAVATRRNGSPVQRSGDGEGRRRLPARRLTARRATGSPHDRKFTIADANLNPVYNRCPNLNQHREPGHETSVTRRAFQKGRDDMPTTKSGAAKRGFAAMDPAKQREIASKGGKASHGGGRRSSAAR